MSCCGLQPAPCLLPGPPPRRRALPGLRRVDLVSDRLATDTAAALAGLPHLLAAALTVRTEPPDAAWPHLAALGTRLERLEAMLSLEQPRRVPPALRHASAALGELRFHLRVEAWSAGLFGLDALPTLRALVVSGPAPPQAWACVGLRSLTLEFAEVAPPRGVDLAAALPSLRSLALVCCSWEGPGLPAALLQLTALTSLTVHVRSDGDGGTATLELPRSLSNLRWAGRWRRLVPLDHAANQHPPPSPCPSQQPAAAGAVGRADGPQRRGAAPAGGAHRAALVQGRPAR